MFCCIFFNNDLANQFKIFPCLFCGLIRIVSEMETIILALLFLLDIAMVLVLLVLLARDP